MLLCITSRMIPIQKNRGEKGMEAVNHNTDWVIQFYADMVYRIAFTYSQNKSDSEDIVQEVFMRYLKLIPQFESEEHRKAWIIRVAINCCKNLVTSSWKRKVSLLPAEIDQRKYQMHTNKTGYDDVYEAIAKLKQTDRILVHLFYYEDYSIGEIAQMLNLKESAVKTRLFRVRKKLKDLLEGEEPYETNEIPTVNG